MCTYAYLCMCTSVCLAPSGPLLFLTLSLRLASPVYSIQKPYQTGVGSSLSSALTSRVT